MKCSWLANTSGMKYSLQPKMNVNSVVAASPGALSGSAKRVNIENHEQPSTRADSSISRGISSKTPFINHTTNGSWNAVYSNIRPRYESYSPTSVNMISSGTANTTGGRNLIDRIQVTMWRPPVRKREKL